MAVKAGFQGGLLFCFAPIFSYFFLKMPYNPYFLTLKFHLHDKNPEFFLARSN